MRRRDFVRILSGALVAPSVAARAQQRLPVVGFLGSSSAAPFQGVLAVFRDALREAGYVEGRNVAIEYRWAEDRYERLPALAADLVRRQVAVIVASGGPVSALAASAATKTIPIVFAAVSDPIRSGLVVSLNRPGGNVTGTSGLTIELDAKRLEILRSLAPGTIAALVNPGRPDLVAQAKNVQEGANALGQQVVLLNAGNEQQIDSAFAQIVQQKIGAVLVGADPFFNSRRLQIIALAARNRVPTMYAQREFVADGGLISYGSRLSDGYRQAGVYVGRILNGEKPADLPVVQPTTFELVINLKTAKALNLALPQALLTTADEVIE
jgi:putative tryptophan/tyrosine transport system substrate-binding protein